MQVRWSPSCKGTSGRASYLRTHRGSLRQSTSSTLAQHARDARNQGAASRTHMRDVVAVPG